MAEEPTPKTQREISSQFVIDSHNTTAERGRTADPGPPPMPGAARRARSDTDPTPVRATAQLD